MDWTGGDCPAWSVRIARSELFQSLADGGFVWDLVRDRGGGAGLWGGGCEDLAECGRNEKGQVYRLLRLGGCCVELVESILVVGKW